MSNDSTKRGKAPFAVESPTRHLRSLAMAPLDRHFRYGRLPAFTIRVALVAGNRLAVSGYWGMLKGEPCD